MMSVLKAKDDHYPRFPSSREIEETHDSRIRLGSPEAGQPIEYYIRRYSKVLAGTSPTGLTAQDFLQGFCFEIALADLYACQHCDNRSSDFRQCRTSRGGGFYSDLNRAKWKKERENNPSAKPSFIMRQCPGSSQRLRDLAEFYRQVMYA